MTPKQYHDDAMRTAAGPEVFHVPEDDEQLDAWTNEFVIDMVEYLKAAARLNDWKSRLFYGKPKYDRGDMVGFMDGAVPPFPEFDKYLEGEMSFGVTGGPRLVHAILGVSTEGAELVEGLLKLMQTRCTVYRPDIAKNAIREGGDVQWYCELLADSLGTTVQFMRAMNIARLRKRFPHKFKEADAIARADEK